VKRTHKGKLRDVLAKNMRRLRAARGISQEALECGINRTYLSSVERLERNVSIDNIARTRRNRRQAIGLALRPPIFDRNVLPLDIAARRRSGSPQGGRDCRDRCHCFG
jgi:transcriptional regulator with XRE-family HTH domain